MLSDRSVSELYVGIVPLHGRKVGKKRMVRQLAREICADLVICCRIQPALSCEQFPSCSVYALHVKGTAFLWHQVSSS